MNDYFCGGGDYFECAAFYEDKNESGSGNNNDNKGLVIGLSVVGAVAFLGLLFAGFLIRREKQGKPVFYEEPTGVSS